MGTGDIHVVTGAFEYSGSYIARRLLAAGHTVRTLTPVPPHGELAGVVEPFPMTFKEDDLLAAFAGAKALYNTYWIRYNRRGWTSQVQAVENTLNMFRAAKKSGIERIVHVSITNPSPDSPYDYFRHKYTMEQGLIASGVSYAILRPALLFGGRDILVNNMAWVVRHMPVIGVFGRGRYRMRPIHVEDLAALAVEQGARRENAIIDAVGPETFTYRGFFKELCRILGKRRLVVPLPPRLAFALVWLFGKIVHDTILTWQETAALMADLLCAASPPAGATRLTDWAREHADTLGKHYASESARRKSA
ncbi:MAG: SDR family oxidoreductase [Phycisphaerae bacterium]